MPRPNLRTSHRNYITIPIKKGLTEIAKPFHIKVEFRGVGKEFAKNWGPTSARLSELAGKEDPVLVKRNYVEDFN